MKRPKMPNGKPYPKLVRVRETDYFVTFVKRLKESDMGVCDDTAKVIYLSLDQPADELYRTFHHEIAHAIECEYGIKLGHPTIRKLEVAYALIVPQLC